MEKKPRNNRLIGLIVGLLVSLPIFGIIIFDLLPESRTEFDVPNKKNDKIVPMFDKQLEYQINNYEKNSIKPGLLVTTKAHVVAYLKTIARIENYSRYGVNSTTSRNSILVKITFKDGSIVKDVYTGRTSSGILPPPILLAVELENGKTKQVFTNGREKEGSPDWIISDLNYLIDAAIHYDMNRNQDPYYGPNKTSEDYKKEWEDQ